MISIFFPATAFTILSIETYYNVIDMFIFFAGFLFFSIVYVLVLGFPAFFLLRPYRPGHWWSVAAVGFFIGHRCGNDVANFSIVA
jgi:hypothetical protein